MHLVADGISNYEVEVWKTSHKKYPFFEKAGTQNQEENKTKQTISNRHNYPFIRKQNPAFLAMNMTKYFVSRQKVPNVENVTLRVRLYSMAKRLCTSSITLFGHLIRWLKIVTGCFITVLFFSGPVNTTLYCPGHENITPPPERTLSRHLMEKREPACSSITWPEKEVTNRCTCKNKDI